MIESPFAWCVALAPLTLAATAALLDDAGPRRSARVAIYGAGATFGFALIAVLGVLFYGPLSSPLLGGAGLGFSIYVDVLSVIMLALVSFVGVIVVAYSRNYLDGDPGQVRFTRWLLLTLASVLTLLCSGNLVLLIMAWIATSLSLNKLLLFYGQRPAAQRAARKKFIVSRLGDTFLILAALLLYLQFGTLEIADLIHAARSGSDAAQPGAITIAALLIVLTATLKSAQLPLHGWLLEVMETPTPVSALLHAGIINAGGFLILRLADVMVHAAPALEILAIIGGATALFGSLVMLTQTSIKVQLAYSTIAQMGFMLLQCGLGAFSSALLHIVAHSLYKAHAFLSSGSVMDLARASWTPSPGGQPHPARLVVALIAVIGLTLGVGSMFGITLQTSPGAITFGAILLMGLVHLIANSIDERPNVFVISRSAVFAAGVAGIYFTLQAGAAALLAGSVPVDRVMSGGINLVIASMVVLSFAALTLFQNQMMRHAKEPFWTEAYIHLRNGLYLNTLANRLVLEHWPKFSKLS